ncbi:hypothetical protein O9993_00730 [Vibrio lentus]|nr:hypothetical protein [Vibrio lentus]
MTVIQSPAINLFYNEDGLIRLILWFKLLDDDVSEEINILRPIFLDGTLLVDPLGEPQCR